MKKIVTILFIFVLFVFVCMPFRTYADGITYGESEFIAPGYVSFKTTIHNWNHIDPLTYPCGSLNSSITLENDINTYSYGSCSNNTVVLNNYNFEGDSDIVIRETIRVTNNMKKYGFYLLGFFGASNEFTGTPFEAYLMREYNNPGYFKVIDRPEEDELEPVGSSPVEEEVVEEAIEPEEEGNYEILGVDGATEFVEIYDASSFDLGTVNYPTGYYMKYQFVVRGDLADPSGTFQYRFDEVEQYRTAVHGDAIAFYNNVDSTSPSYRSISLTDLSNALEEKPEVVYTGVYNENEYAVFLHTVGGEGYASIIADPDDEDCYGITFEIEARNDSTIANTGLLYDMWPFAILMVAVIGLMVFFKKGKLKEEKIEKIDDEII